MSKGEIKQLIREELQRLNRRIDEKIVRGESYRDEAKQHRELCVYLSRVAPAWNVDMKKFSEGLSRLTALFF